MPKWLFVAVAIFFANSAFAKDPVVFDVRRSLSLDDKPAPKDYYINAGANDGLKEGMIITVVRRQSLYDAYQNKSPGDLVVAVGQVRLIHVQADISVARLEKILERDELPSVDFEAVMVGDRVDLSSAKMPTRKTASLDEDVLESVPAHMPPAVAAPTLPTPVKSVDISTLAPVSVGGQGPL